MIDLRNSGLNWQKAWVARRDDLTRFDHVLTNPKEFIPLNQPFVVGGQQLMYPTDTSLGASAGNIVNCRCSLDLRVV